MANDVLATSLFPKSRREVLALLYGHPGERYYLREIADIVQIGMGQCQRELKRLSDAGIIRRFRQGRHVYFEASEDCPIYAELRGIIAKTAGVVAILTEALQPIAETIDVAFVYGSVARGEERSASDLDLFVIGDVSFGEVVGVISAAESNLRRAINPSVYSLDDFKDKLKAGNHFLKSVMKGDKLFVIGNSDELGKLAS